MAELKTDPELLREYSEKGSEGAFRLLVERHADLVYATALRGLSNAREAEEITQTVFLALARKGAWLRGEINLAGWLHKTTLLEVRKWWRGELRRQRREQTAVELGTVMKDDDSLLKSLAEELDEGLLTLSMSERQALMLRYFEGRPHREIGALLGAREDAIRMRIEKALARLTRFFQRRGYAVTAVATTITVLGAAATAAPAGFARAAASSALSAAGGGSAVAGLKLLFSRFLGLSKTQTAAICLTIAVPPMAWEWNTNRKAATVAAVQLSQIEKTRNQQTALSAEVARLRAESIRLEAAIDAAEKTQARYGAAAGKLTALKARVSGLLSDAGYQWPTDLPYVRVRKSVVRSLDLLHHVPSTFHGDGKLTGPALELFGMTAQEKTPTELALANYWKGANELTSAAAYETNSPATQSGRLTKKVIVPPLGQALTALAAETQAQLTSVLGSEREKLLFDGWDEGAIQLFWPGNQWKIATQPQTFEVWVEANPPDGPRFGASRSSTLGGTSAEGPHSLGVIPEPILERFFNPWLLEHGITNGIPHE